METSKIDSKIVKAYLCFEIRLSFQVFVRELVEDEPKSSRPVTVTVNLKDINDNAPILEAVPDISIVAGNTKRNIATVRSINISFHSGKNSNLPQQLFMIYPFKIRLIKTPSRVPRGLSLNDDFY